MKTADAGKQVDECEGHGLNLLIGCDAEKESDGINDLLNSFSGNGASSTFVVHPMATLLMQKFSLRVEVS